METGKTGIRCWDSGFLITSVTRLSPLCPLAVSVPSETGSSLDGDKFYRAIIFAAFLLATVLVFGKGYAGPKSYTAGKYLTWALYHRDPPRVWYSSLLNLTLSFLTKNNKWWFIFFMRSCMDKFYTNSSSDSVLIILINDLKENIPTEAYCNFWAMWCILQNRFKKGAEETVQKSFTN